MKCKICNLYFFDTILGFLELTWHLIQIHDCPDDVRIGDNIDFGA